MRKEAIGARALRFAKIEQALARLAGQSGSTSTKALAREIAAERSAKGILQASSLPRAITQPGRGQENLAGLLSSLPAGRLHAGNPDALKRVTSLMQRFDLGAKKLKTKSVSLSDASRRSYELYKRLHGATTAMSPGARARAIKFTSEPSPVAFEKLRRAVGKVTPQTRFSAFDADAVRSMPAGAPTWYTPRLLVANRYLGRGRNLLAKTTEKTLKQFGPTGPVTPHVGVDNRAAGSAAEGYLARMRRQLQSGRNYEQVATFPGVEKFPRGQQIFQLVGNKIRELGPRAFGKS